MIRVCRQSCRRNMGWPPNNPSRTGGDGPDIELRRAVSAARCRIVGSTPPGKDAGITVSRPVQRVPPSYFMSWAGPVGRVLHSGSRKYKEPCPLRTRRVQEGRRSRRFPGNGDEKGMRCGLCEQPNSEAVPATVSGERDIYVRTALRPSRQPLGRTLNPARPGKAICPSDDP